MTMETVDNYLLDVKSQIRFETEKNNFLYFKSRADPENSERGDRVPPTPLPSPNENFTFQDTQHAALWAYS